MAPLSPTQRAWRGRIETGLRFAAPFLDLLLAAGERLSYAVDRDPIDSAQPARRVKHPDPQPTVGPGSTA